METAAKPLRFNHQTIVHYNWQCSKHKPSFCWGLIMHWDWENQRIGEWGSWPYHLHRPNINPGTQLGPVNNKDVATSQLLTQLCVWCEMPRRKKKKKKDPKGAAFFPLNLITSISNQFCHLAFEMFWIYETPHQSRLYYSSMLLSQIPALLYCSFLFSSCPLWLHPLVAFFCERFLPLSKLFERKNDVHKANAKGYLNWLLHCCVLASCCRCCFCLPRLLQGELKAESLPP